MPCQDGWAAINLEMPRRVPRTEYSADAYHWDLIKAVTGRDVRGASAAERQAASLAFKRAWKYDFEWSVLVHGDVLARRHTNMGHADYAEGGADRQAAGSCPFEDPEEVLGLNFFATYGTIDQAEWTRKFEQHYRAQAGHPDCDWVCMTGIYVTLLSGLIDILGWDMLLLTAGTDPQGFGEVANRYAAWIQQYFDALGRADVPLVMIHDDIVWTSGPFIAPDWYRRYVFANYRKLFAPLLASGKKIAYTSDGNYSIFLDDVVACGVHGLVMEPSTDMHAFAEKYGRSHFFIGNVDTRVLLTGSQAKIRGEVERCMAIGKNCPGFFLAVGNHIPANTPVENALYYNQVYEKLSVRK